MARRRRSGGVASSRVPPRNPRSRRGPGRDGRISRGRMAQAAESGQSFPRGYRFRAYSRRYDRRLVPERSYAPRSRSSRSPLHPDGSSVVYVLRRTRGDDYVSHLWTRPWGGGRAQQLTRGGVRDGSPAISPDGGASPTCGRRSAMTTRLPRSGSSHSPAASRSSSRRSSMASGRCAGARAATGCSSSHRPGTSASSSARRRRDEPRSPAGSRVSTSATTSPGTSSAARICGSSLRGRARRRGS